MKDIQEQMVQAIEQMKNNVSQSQQTFECDLEDSVQAIEQMKSCIFQNIFFHSDKNSEIWEKIKCWGKLHSGSDSIDKKYIMNYCGFLEFLEDRGIICGEKAFGVPAESIIAKLDDCYARGKLQGHAYYSYKSENVYLNAIEGRSKEEVQILRDIYPEELTCISVIVKDCIENPKYAQWYLELFPEELLETLKSEKLLYYIFWEWNPDDTLRFIQSALDYDKDYFKDYKDEMGNNCLYYYLARFELVQNSDYYYSKREIIKSLLLESGVNPDEKNNGGISYHDLSPYFENYQIFSEESEYFWWRYDGEEDLFPEDYGGYASNNEMTQDCKELGWYKWICKYLIYTPQSKWNPRVKFMADLFGIEVASWRHESREWREKMEKVNRIDNLLWQVKCIGNLLLKYEDMQCQIEDMQCQIEDMQYQFQEQIEDKLNQKDIRAFKAKYAPRHQSRRCAA